MALVTRPGEKFNAVCFDDVLGFNGSVVPLVGEHIANGSPVTLTHQDRRDILRRLHEAAQLSVQARALSEGGDVFLLEMGDPAKIIDLTRNMIRLAGKTLPDGDNLGGDVAIVTIGARAGEKLFEESLGQQQSRS